MARMNKPAKTPPPELKVVGKTIQRVEVNEGSVVIGLSDGTEFMIQSDLQGGDYDDYKSFLVIAQVIKKIVKQEVTESIPVVLT